MRDLDELLSEFKRLRQEAKTLLERQNASAPENLRARSNGSLTPQRLSVRQEEEESTTDRSWVRHDDDNSLETEMTSSQRSIPDTEECGQSSNLQRTPIGTLASMLPRCSVSSEEHDDRPWTSEELNDLPPAAEIFLNQLWHASDDETSLTAKKFICWARSRGLELNFRRGRKCMSFSPAVRFDGVPVAPVAIWSNGILEVRFWALRGPFDDAKRRRELRERLNKVQFVFIPKAAIWGHHDFGLQSLNADSSYDAFVAVLDWHFGLMTRP